MHGAGVSGNRDHRRRAVRLERGEVAEKVAQLTALPTIQLVFVGQVPEVTVATKRTSCTAGDGKASPGVASVGVQVDSSSGVDARGVKTVSVSSAVPPGTATVAVMRNRTSSASAASVGSVREDAASVTASSTDAGGFGRDRGAGRNASGQQ